MKKFNIILLTFLIAFTAIYAETIDENRVKRIEAAKTTYASRLEKAENEKNMPIEKAEKKCTDALNRENEKIDDIASNIHYGERNAVNRAVAEDKRKLSASNKRKENIIKLKEKEILDAEKKFKKLFSEKKRI